MAAHDVDIEQVLAIETRTTVIEWNCMSRSAWTKDSENLPDKVVWEPNHIIIPDTSKQDEGLYVCKESSHYNKSDKHFTLRVAGKF